MPASGRPADDDAYDERLRLDLLLLRAGPARIGRQSLSQQAAEAIKARIFSLDLPPGSRLVIDDLASTLGVSRTPVREGLRELISEGLVTYDGNTYAVTTFTRPQIEDLFAIRRVLEALAASQAAQRMSPGAVEELRALVQQGANRIAAGDTEFLISSDMRFHGDIAAGANNPRLRQLLGSLREQSWMIRRWGFLKRLAEPVETATVEEHLAILERLAGHDGAGAAALMEEHLRKGERRTLEWLGL